MPHKPPIFGQRQRQARAKAAAKHTDDHRGSVTERGYGHKWRVGLCEQTLREEPWCRLCLAAGRLEPSVVADHIKPKSQGGANDRSNTQGLCWSCHQKKRGVESHVLF